jgi:hypothetical protein
MSTCRPNLTHSILTNCEIITFKVEEKVFFHCAREGQQCFVGQKNHFSASVWLAGPQILVHSWVRYMCAKSHIHQRCGRLPKIYFPQRGMQKFTYKGRFLTIKIAYEKFLDWKSKRWNHALVPPLHIEIFIFEKH